MIPIRKFDKLEAIPHPYDPGMAFVMIWKGSTAHLRSIKIQNGGVVRYGRRKYKVKIQESK